MNILITRQQNVINNSRFGILKVNGNYYGFTLENNLKLIAAGRYTGTIYKSPKLVALGRTNTEVILLNNVVGRTFIEMHIANYSSELEGCIAPGSYTDGEMLCDSSDVFKRIMILAQMATSIEIEVI